MLKSMLHLHDIQNWVPSDSTAKRLKAACVDCHEGKAARTGWADLVALTQQELMLRAFQNPEGYTPQEWLSGEWFTFPKGENWPTSTQWQQAGFQTRETGQSIDIQAGELWAPSWLEGDVSPLKRVYANQVHRLSRQSSIPGDPWWKEAFPDFPGFRNRGQQASVYRALLAQPGEAHLFILPTGTGKTVIFHSLLKRFPNKVHVLIVPTTALAIDQAARLQNMRRESQPFAYHSGLSSEQRRDIRRSLRDGSCQFVITSPEAIEYALRDTVFEVASQGRLHSIVLDEAHMVSQWGNDFRPSFQNLANFHRALLQAPLHDEGRHRIFFLTATITQDGVDTLRQLFAEDLGVTSFLYLRPEPAFWVAKCDSEENRSQRLKEVLLHLPRPWILYVTKVADAEKRYEEAIEWGHRRICMITGGGNRRSTLGESMDGLLRLWREGELDGVIATSAFGLGMDLAEVRSVVHACVPETVDRFYQEVGRGGRDGRACLSLLLWKDGDVRIAEQLNRDVLISSQRAWERWEKLRLGGQYQEGGRIAVDLDQRPADIEKSSDLNRSWNIRTLLFLQRAGLISLEYQKLPLLSREPNESDEKYEARCEQHTRTFFRRVLVRRNENKAFSSVLDVDAAFAPLKARIHSASQQTFEDMKRILESDKPLHRILVGAYQLGEPIRSEPTRHRLSCPVTRKSRIPSGELLTRFPEPQTTPMAASTFSEPPPLVSERGEEAGHRVLWVVYDGSMRFSSPRERRERTRHLQKVIEWGIHHGAREILLPQEIEGLDEGVWKPHKWHQFIPFVSAQPGLPQKGERTVLAKLGLPRLTLWTEEELVDGSLPFDLLYDEEAPIPWQVALIPEGLRDHPPRTDRLFVDVRKTIQLSELLECIR